MWLWSERTVQHLDAVNVNILVAILDYQFAGCYHGEEMGKRDTGSLLVLFHTNVCESTMIPK